MNTHILYAPGHTPIGQCHTKESIEKTLSRNPNRVTFRSLPRVCGEVMESLDSYKALTDIEDYVSNESLAVDTIDDVDTMLERHGRSLVLALDVLPPSAQRVAHASRLCYNFAWRRVLEGNERPRA